MPTIRASLRLLALLVVATVMFASCGGGSDDAESSGDEKSTTTTTTRPEADEATKALAIAATPTTAEFGAGWKEFSKGQVNELDGKSCGYTEGGPQAKLATGASYVSPTAELEGKGAFVTGRSYVFATEEDAIAWVEVAKSPEWASCWQENLQEFNDKRKTGGTIENTTAQAAPQQIDAYAQFTGKNDKGEVTSQADFYVRRNGRVVTLWVIESGGMTEADAATLNAGQEAAFNALWARIDAAT